MAIPWLAVLKSVPWVDVIRKAPDIADGAKKLWNSVGGKAAPAAVATPDAEPTPESGAEAIRALRTRVASLEAATAELHAQMLASSELITALADQNIAIVKRAEANRVRVRRLTGALIVVAIVAVAALVANFVR